jgi:(E)-4-hydroxy-3-methyl-but-2-enyl pyrophosphate reductase
MKLVVAQSIGFCSGVKRAIQGAEKVLSEESAVYCLGEIIHNPQVVERLKDQGMIIVDDIAEVPRKSRFIIRSHGLSREAIELARDRKLIIHDFTCPKVKKIHTLVKTLTEEGYFIFIVGNPRHPEVKAIRSLADENAMVVEREKEIPEEASVKQNAVVVQTTFNPQSFLPIVQKVVSFSKKTLVYNTLCEETIKRQKEALELSGKVDLIVVVGGKKSSNTKTLYEIVNNHTKGFHIESESELRKEWFNEVSTVGLVSGASTPEDMVIKVSERLRSFQ